MCFTTESISGHREVGNSYAREERAHSNQPTYTMEFQDVAAAAQAAAESAERATMAARAAAVLASRENISRQGSSGSHGSPTNRKYERPEKLREYLDESIAVETVSKGNDETERSQGMNSEVQYLHQDERMKGILRREATKAPNDDYSTGREAPSQFSSYTSQGCVDNDKLNADLHKDFVREHTRVQKISSELEAVELDYPNMKYENVQSSRENSDVNYSKAASSPYVTDDEKFSNVNKHEDESEIYRVDDREPNFGSNNKQSASSDTSPIVFDSYSSDAEDSSSVFGRNRGNLFGSDLEESNRGSVSINQNRSGSSNRNSGSYLHLFRESQPEEHSDKMSKLAPSISNLSKSPAFDVSDGENSETENEVATSSHKEIVRPSNFLLDHGRSTSSSFSVDSVHESNKHYMSEKKEVKESIRDSRIYDEETQADLYTVDKSSTRSGSGSLPGSQPSPRMEKVPSNPHVSKGSTGYSLDDEETLPLGFKEKQPTREAEDIEEYSVSSVHLSSESSDVSNESIDESGLGINFGRLTGGFKHRGFPRPPYVRSLATDSAKQTSDSAPTAEKLAVLDVDRQPASFEVASQGRYNHESHGNAYTSASRTTRAAPDPYSDTVEGLASRHASEETTHLEEREFISRNAKATEVEVPSQEPYHPRSRVKGYKEVRLNSQGVNDDPDDQPHYAIDSRYSASTPQKQNIDAHSEIDKLTSSLPSKASVNSEVPDPEEYESPLMKAKKVTSTRMTYLDSHGSESVVDSKPSVGTRAKLSRRTRDVPSESKSSSASSTGPPRNTNYDEVAVQERQSSKHLQSSPSAEQSSVAAEQISPASLESRKSHVTPIDNVVRSNNENAKSSSSGEPASRDSTLKQAPRTHPKLPDYESLAAHFHSLRSNRR